MRLPLSFEFFPTKTPEGAVKLRAVRQQLYARKPEFCSVTYGAGGSTHQGTFGAVREILSEGVDAASHFSCIGATRATVREQLAELKAMGVKRLVALRGDLPSGYGIGGEFLYASDLVAFIREETGRDFHIEVACYPEVHPQARSPEADMQAFAAKVKAGADSAITHSTDNANCKRTQPGDLSDNMADDRCRSIQRRPSQQLPVIRDARTSAVVNGFHRRPAHPVQPPVDAPAAWLACRSPAVACRIARP